MEKRWIPGIEKEISLLGFGCMRLPRLTSETGEAGEIDKVAAQQMIDRAIELGVNYFDTAYPYIDGKSELFLGEAMKKYPRESFYLASKMPTWDLIQSPEDVDRIFNHQLQKCQVEYFDFYLMHSLNESNNQRAEACGVYAYLQKQKDAGRIRHLGFSFHDSPPLLERIVSEREYEFAQIQLNYLDWEALNAKRQYEILTEHGIPVVIMEPVRGGALATLTDKAVELLRSKDPEASVASWAIRFAASLPNVMTVLSGMSTLEQVEDNGATMSNFRPLSEAEKTVVFEAARVYRAAGTVPCTGCRYCMDCPAGVDIPRLFVIYNHYCAYKNPVAFRNNYRSLLKSQQAHNCIACGQCMRHCPQGIPIPDHMREIAVLAEKYVL